MVQNKVDEDDHIVEEYNDNSGGLSMEDSTQKSGFEDLDSHSFLKQNEKDVYSSIEEEAAPVKDIAMSPVGCTLQFPRVDNMYRKKESLPYDETKANIWKNRPRDVSMDEAKEWFAYSLIGLFVGTIAFGMILLEEFLLDHTIHLTETIVQKG